MLQLWFQYVKKTLDNRVCRRGNVDITSLKKNIKSSWYFLTSQKYSLNQCIWGDTPIENEPVSYSPHQNAIAEVVLVKHLCLLLVASAEEQLPKLLLLPSASQISEYPQLPPATPQHWDHPSVPGTTRTKRNINGRLFHESAGTCKPIYNKPLECLGFSASTAGP